MARSKSSKPKSKKVASASRKKRKKRAPRMIDEAVVISYLSKLEAALGDEDAFTPLFEALVDDEKVGQAEAVSIASEFVSRTAQSTSRAKALDKVLKRHTALITFKLKQRAMAGRSAA